MNKALRAAQKSAKSPAHATPTSGLVNHSTMRLKMFFAKDASTVSIVESNEYAILSTPRSKMA
jgi:hypothetical protein